MVTILAAILTVAFGGFVVNWLIHKWQQKNWINQQRFLGSEKEYLLLRDVFDEIVSLAGQRLYRMRRLLWAMRSSPSELIRMRLDEYDKAQIAWNDKLSGFSIKLRMYAPYHIAFQLDSVIQRDFADLGVKLEHMAAGKLNGGQPQKLHALEQELNRFQGKLILFGREIVHAIQSKKRLTYTGTQIEFGESTLELFPTGKLLEALFKRREQSFSIVRTAADVEPPLLRGH